MMIREYECSVFFFFFQAEDGIRDWSVTGVQTCALPIFLAQVDQVHRRCAGAGPWHRLDPRAIPPFGRQRQQIGRASCRERGEMSVVAGSLKKKTGRKS